MLPVSMGKSGDFMGINPENILRSSSYDEDGDLLSLSYIGLSPKGSKKWPYRPPEMRVYQPFCPKYDMWSLGCLYLDLFIWWLQGFDGLLRYKFKRWARSRRSSSEYEQEFFIIINASGKKEAKINPAVLEEIGLLRELHADDPFARPMLELIENKMLLVDKTKRFSADGICAAVSRIASQLP